MARPNRKKQTRRTEHGLKAASSSSVPKDDIEIVEGPDAEKAKVTLEIKKLKAELKGHILENRAKKLAWWKRADYQSTWLAPAATIVAATIGLVYLFWSGWFDTKREELLERREALERDVAHLQVEKAHLEKSQSDLQHRVANLGRTAKSTQELLARIRRINAAGGTVTTEANGSEEASYYVSFYWPMSPQSENAVRADGMFPHESPHVFAPDTPLTKPYDLDLVADDLAALPKLASLDINVVQYHLSKSALGKLAKSAALVRLNLFGGSIPDETFESLMAMKNLEVLSCVCRDPLQIPSLAQLPRLKVLCLFGISITESNARNIAAAAQLETLWIDAITVDSMAIKQLRELRSLRDLLLLGSPIGDKGLEQYSELESLTRADFLATDITETGLHYLHKLKKLRSLHIWGPMVNVTDHGLKSVARLTALESLHLDSRGFTDLAAEHLSNLKNLRSLVIMHSQISGRGLAKLLPLPKLERLNLHGCCIDDEGAREFRSLTSLKELDIGQLHQHGPGPIDYPPPKTGPIGDAGLIGFRSLGELRYLELAGNNVTDEGIAGLAALRSLRYLGIRGTKITPQGAGKLRALLPATQVVY